MYQQSTSGPSRAAFLTRTPSCADIRERVGWSFRRVRQNQRRRQSCATTRSDIGLPFPGHRAVAHECRQDLLVTEVLAPGFELLGRLAKLLSQCRQRLAEAMRIEIRQIRSFKCFLKDPPYRGRIAPAHPIEADSCKKALFPSFDSSRRKQRIVRTEQALLGQK